MEKTYFAFAQNLSMCYEEYRKLLSQKDPTKLEVGLNNLLTKMDIYPELIGCRPFVSKSPEREKVIDKIIEAGGNRDDDNRILTRSEVEAHVEILAKTCVAHFALLDMIKETIKFLNNDNNGRKHE